MKRPNMTDDQREIAIELMANALRKDAHLRARALGSDPSDAVRGGITRRRAEASQRYVDGMRDMLRVLFPNGHAIAEECMDAAYARAMGIPHHKADGEGGLAGH